MHVTVKESWADERLDDLNEKVDKGFADVDKRFDKLEDRMEAMQKEMNIRFEGLHKSMHQSLLGTCAMMVTMFVGLAGLIVSQM